VKQEPLPCQVTQRSHIPSASIAAGGAGLVHRSFMMAMTLLTFHILPVNRIQAMMPDLAPPFWGAYFKGTNLPQNRVHLPHLEGER